MTSGAELAARERGALRYRVATAAVGLPVVVAAVWFGGPILAVLIGAVGIVATIEIRRLLSVSDRSFLAVTVALGVTLVVAAFVGWSLWPHVFFGVAAVGLLLRVASRLRVDEVPARISPLTATLGPLYPAALLSFGLATHALVLGPGNAGAEDLGRNWLLFALMLIFASDTSAYFVGRAVGHRQLAPRISPGKTWEGAIGAVIGTSVAGGLLSTVLPLQSDALFGLEAPADLLAFAVIGAGISILAQLGDLFESALKRSAGAKEAGGLLPGHGGFLDRLDSILPVLPAVYYGLLWAS